MLSNTDEINPSPKAVGHDGGGSVSTGISDASATSAIRKSAPFAAAGAMLQSVRRANSAIKMPSQIAKPSSGATSPKPGKNRLEPTFALLMVASTPTTIATRTQSIVISLAAGRVIGA